MGSNQTTTAKPGNVWIPLTVGMVFITILYFGLPCHRYLSDGLLTAIRMREGWVVHPNHPLYPLLPQILFFASGALKSGLTELEILTLWSMASGVIACLAILLAIRWGSGSVTTAVFGLTLFAFIKGIWYFSVIPSPSSSALAPQVLALAAIAYVLKKFPDEPSRKDYLTIGIFTSLAILASQFNAVLLLPVAYLIYLGKPSTREVTRDLFIFITVTVIAVLAVLVLSGAIGAGVRSVTDFMNWQHSYVFGSRWWVHSIPEMISRNWIGWNDVLVTYPFRGDGVFGDWSEGFGTSFWYKQLPVRIGQALFLLFLFFETIRAVYLWIRTRKLLPIQIVGLLTALPLMLFSCVWTPDTIHYRILYFPGYILFLMPSLAHYYKLQKFSLKKSWPLILAIACLFLGNLFNQFIPQSDPAKNKNYWDIMVLENVVEPGDLIIFSGSGDGGLRERYAQYFLECETIRSHDLIIRFRTYPDDVLADLRQRHHSGAKLFVHDDALYSDEDVEWINATYNLDIQPGELLDFMNTWVIGVEEYTVLDKKYYQFVPREEPDQ